MLASQTLGAQTMGNYLSLPKCLLDLKLASGRPSRLGASDDSDIRTWCGNGPAMIRAAGWRRQSGQLITSQLGSGDDPCSWVAQGWLGPFGLATDTIMMVSVIPSCCN